MKTTILSLLVAIGLIGSASAQTYPNYLQHSLDNLPPGFIAASSQVGDQNFHPLPNTEFKDNGEEYKICTYNLQEIHPHMYASCLYVNSGSHLFCIGARFFLIDRPNSDGVGIIGPRTLNLLGQLLDKGNLTQEQYSRDFRTIKGQTVVGNPPWVFAGINNNEYALASRLDDSEFKNPLASLERIAVLFDKYIDKPSQEIVLTQQLMQREAKAAYDADRAKQEAINAQEAAQKAIEQSNKEKNQLDFVSRLKSNEFILGDVKSALNENCFSGTAIIRDTSRSNTFIVYGFTPISIDNKPVSPLVDITIFNEYDISTLNNYPLPINTPEYIIESLTKSEKSTQCNFTDDTESMPISKYLSEKYSKFKEWTDKAYEIKPAPFSKGFPDNSGEFIWNGDKASVHYKIRFDLPKKTVVNEQLNNGFDDKVFALYITAINKYPLVLENMKKLVKIRLENSQKNLDKVNSNFN